MEQESLLAFVIVGLVAGFLAGKALRGSGFGLVVNLAVGVVGAVVAGWLLPLFGVSFGTGILAAILHATIGAVVLLVVLGWVVPAD